MAAVQHLPATEPILATEAANLWLVKNGAEPEDLDCIEFTDRLPIGATDGLVDTVRVCVRRESPGVFSSMAGLDFIYISAASTATTVFVLGEPVYSNFIALNPTECESMVVGASHVFISEGPIMINSDCHCREV